MSAWRHLLFFLLGASLTAAGLRAQDTGAAADIHPADSLSEAVIIGFTETGSTPYPGVVDIPAELILQTPAALGEPDLLKTLQMLPGVQSGNDGFSGIFIRGGGQDETLFMLDGAPMYGVTHAFGLISSFAPEAVEEVILHKGPFPSGLGGRVSGVVDVRTVEGDMQQTRGTVSAGLLSDRLHLEGPVVRERLSYSVSARVLHTLLAAPLIKWLGGDVNYFFYDLHGKLSWKISGSDRLRLSAYLSDDRFYGDFRYKATAPESSEMLYWRRSSADMAWGGRLVSLNWRHEYGDALSSETVVYFSSYRSNSEWTVEPEAEDELKTASNSLSAITDIGGKMDFDWRISDGRLMKFGISSVRHAFAPSTEISFGSSSGEEMYGISGGIGTSGWENALYAEGELRFWNRMTLAAGIRGVQMTCGEETFWSLEPRASLSFDFGRGFSANAAAGRSSQYVHQLSSSAPLLDSPADIWIPSTSKIMPLIGDILSAGVRWSGLKGWEFSLEGYLRHSSNIVDYKDGVSPANVLNTDFEDMLALGESRSAGLEFMAVRTFGNTTGRLSYTLSKTDRLFADGSVNAGKPFPDTYDRRHNIALFVNHRFNEKMDLSASWVYMSGAMTTVPDNITAAVDPGYDSYPSGTPVYLPQVTSRNNYRLPPTHRLSLNFNLRRDGRRGENIWTFGVYNVYNAMNPNLIFYALVSERGKYEYDAVKLTFLPVLPSVSYTFRF